MPELQVMELTQKKQDADSFIKEVLKKVPEKKKIELLRLVEGFALCASSDQKAG